MNILIGARTNAKPQEIILLHADINYTHIYLANGKQLMVAMPLKELEKRFLCCNIFYRTHKSYMINLHYIKNLDISSGSYVVEMKNNFRVLVSRRKKNNFLETISQKPFL